MGSQQSTPQQQQQQSNAASDVGAAAAGIAFLPSLSFSFLGFIGCMIGLIILMVLFKGARGGGQRGRGLLELTSE